jgi:hypothetical protein
MWRRVDLVSTDDSEERVASIFRVEKYAVKTSNPTKGNVGRKKRPEMLRPSADIKGKQCKKKKKKKEEEEEEAKKKKKKKWWWW